MNIFDFFLVLSLFLIILILYKINKKIDNFILNFDLKKNLNNQQKKETKFDKQKKNQLVSQCSDIQNFDFLPGDENIFNTNDEIEIISKKESLYLHNQSTKGWELISIKHHSLFKRQYYFKRLYFPDS